MEISEQPEKYTFEVKFTGTIGIPPNMDDLTAAIEELKPAHLGYRYIILYRTHAMLRAYRHQELKKYTHAQLRGGALT